MYSHYPCPAPLVDCSYTCSPAPPPQIKGIPPSPEGEGGGGILGYSMCAGSSHYSSGCQPPPLPIPPRERLGAGVYNVLFLD
jgi:hypothetical protein